MDDAMVALEDALSHIDDSGVEPSNDFVPPLTHEQKQNYVLRDLHERRKRQMEMAALFSKGNSLQQIARTYEVHVEQVARDINDLVKSFHEESKKTMREKVSLEIALLYMVQLEAINAWFASQEGRYTNTQKKEKQIRSINLAFNASGKRGGKRGQKFLTQQQAEAEIINQLAEAFGDEDQKTANGNGNGSSNYVRFDTNVDENEQSTTQHKTSPGESKFLTLILECHDRRVRLYNLAPKAGSAADEETLQAEVESMTPLRRAQMLKTFLEKARQGRAKQLALNPQEAIVSVQEMNRRPLKTVQAVPITRPTPKVNEPEMPEF